ncbi:MAG: DUF58 domain-containing protein [Candidatus Rokubacteria bacterium]|nr:DUF58 domain-containing protein [Candidatus Rokubacteria bacterium]
MGVRPVAGERGQGLLSGDFLIQLERLALLSKRTFRGRVKGERKSPHRGSSVEFVDYRPYGVGDDLRYVDWNIFGRLDRLYLKLFVDEEDLCLHLLLDASASMDYGEPTKLEYGPWTTVSRPSSNTGAAWGRRSASWRS